MKTTWHMQCFQKNSGGYRSMSEQITVHLNILKKMENVMVMKMDLEMLSENIKVYIFLEKKLSLWHFF